MTVVAMLICFRIVVSFDLNENTNQDESAVDEDAEEDPQYAENDHEIMGKVTVKFCSSHAKYQQKQQNITAQWNPVNTDTKGT